MSKESCQSRRVWQLSLFGLSAAGCMLLLLVGCFHFRSTQGREVVTTAEYPSISIAVDGSLMHENMPLSEKALVALVKSEVEKSYLPENTKQDYGIIFVDADDKVPHGRVRSIKNLIIQHGGRPATRAAKQPSNESGK